MPSVDVTEAVSGEYISPFGVSRQRELSSQVEFRRGSLNR